MPPAPQGAWQRAPDRCRPGPRQKARWTVESFQLYAGVADQPAIAIEVHAIELGEFRNRHRASLAREAGDTLLNVGKLEHVHDLVVEPRNDVPGRGRRRE